MNSSIFVTAALLATAVVAALAGAVAFGGPKPPPAMASINDPFKAADFSDLPALRHYQGTGGAALAYRYYAAAGAAGTAARGSVVLVHGSSASSNSMHLLAKGFAAAGYAAYALDMRGHGASGHKGQIDYIGQLDDDIASFAQAVDLPRPATLAGFSSGGGFVLRFAGGDRQTLFQSYLLLSPLLSQDAPNYRPNSGGWVGVGVPRVVALTLLNKVGIRAFNDLPVLAFALNDEAKRFLTPSYSFSLAANFRPHSDYEADIRAARQPVTVLAGTADEAFHTDQLEGIFRGLGKDWPVRLLPGIGHIPLTLDARAIDAAVQAVEGLGAMAAAKPPP